MTLISISLIMYEITESIVMKERFQVESYMKSFVKILSVGVQNTILLSMVNRMTSVYDLSDHQHTESSHELIMINVFIKLQTIIKHTVMIKTISIHLQHYITIKNNHFVDPIVRLKPIYSNINQHKCCFFAGNN